MKKFVGTLITLTAIGVAVKVINKQNKTDNKSLNKTDSKSFNKTYVGSVEPTAPVKGDIWFNPNVGMKIY